jgi:hypothetical protein
MSVNVNITYNLCSNWWPHIPLSKMISPGMPHPMCRMCANWLPDIEDIGCGNNWPQERNRKTKRLVRKLNVL